MVITMSKRNERWLSPGDRRDKPATKIAIMNEKGGVGKTTTALYLSSVLASNDGNIGDHRVLLVDCDSQAHASIGLGFTDGNEHLGFDINDRKNISDVFEWNFNIPEENPIYEAVYYVDVKYGSKFFLLPSTPGLKRVINRIGEEFESKYKKLEWAIPKIENYFDYIIFDTPPALGSLEVHNVLNAVDRLLIPVSKYESLHGLRDLFDTVQSVQALRDREIEGDIFCTLYQKSVIVCQKVFKISKEIFGKFFCDNYVSQKAGIANAFSDRVGMKGLSKDYYELAEELIEKWNDPNHKGLFNRRKFNVTDMGKLINATIANKTKNTFVVPTRFTKSSEEEENA